MLTPCQLVALTSRNAGTVRTRTIGSAIYNMCVQAGNIIGSNVSGIQSLLPVYKPSSFSTNNI